MPSRRRYSATAGLGGLASSADSVTAPVDAPARISSSTVLSQSASGLASGASPLPMMAQIRGVLRHGGVTGLEVSSAI